MRCDSLVESLSRPCQTGQPIVLMGDLNCDLYRDDPCSDRSQLIQATLGMLGVAVVSDSKEFTWRTRTIDYVAGNRSFHRWALSASATGSPWGEYVARCDLQTLLHADHAPIQCDVLLEAQAVKYRSRRRCFAGMPRKMVVNDPSLMHEFFSRYVPGQLPFAAAVSELQNIARYATCPLGSLRYVDPPQVKEFCRKRSVCNDPALRRDLSLSIIAARKLAKDAWRRHLIFRAASGDWQARRRLTKRDSLNNALRPTVLSLGGEDLALQKVTEHFRITFGMEEDLNLDDAFRDLPDDELLFGAEEVELCLACMKGSKTTGLSRVSVELLKCLAATEQGLCCLCDILNTALFNPELLLDGNLLLGWVLLVPKKARILDPKELRPIVLGETVVKLLTKLCMARLADTWDPPKSCFGSVRGRGVADAAFISQTCVQGAVAVGAPIVLVKLDISGAYDSVRLSALLRWMASRWSPSTAKSAHLIMIVLCHSVLLFHLFHEEWQQRQCVGTQQGGTHSPVLFSYFVADLFDQLTEQWEAQHEQPPFLAGPYNGLFPNAVPICEVDAGLNLSPCISGLVAQRQEDVCAWACGAKASPEL